MTDADVDGAHIASLLMTFFYREMPGLIDNGHSSWRVPPLYRLTARRHSRLRPRRRHKDELMATTFKGKGKVEISRFKGLGEMPAAAQGDDHGPGAAHAAEGAFAGSARAGHRRAQGRARDR